MYEQFMGDFTYRDSASRQVQLFFSLVNFQATSLLHLLYFSTYSGFKTLFLILKICYEHTLIYRLSQGLDLISKKTNCTCSTPFFLISKKTNLHVRHAFCLSLPLFCTTTTVSCRTKTSNVLVTHYFYREIAVCAYPIFCLVFMFAFIFHCPHFHLASR